MLKMYKYLSVLFFISSATLPCCRALQRPRCSTSSGPKLNLRGLWQISGSRCSYGRRSLLSCSSYHQACPKAMPTAALGKVHASAFECIPPQRQCSQWAPRQSMFAVLDFATASKILPPASLFSSRPVRAGRFAGQRRRQPFKFQK